MQSTSPNRHVPLEGLTNLRDLGGYGAAADAQTAWGYLYRSDSPHRLNDTGRAELERRGVSTVIDLRHAGELEAAPNPLSGLEGYHHVPLFAALPSDPTVHASLETLYAATLEHCGAAIREVVERVIDAPGAVVVHCTAGKDRTGLIAALLLGAVGVSDDTIAEDYALTALHARALLDELLEATRVAGRDAAAYARFLTAEPATMLATLETVHARYGGARAYLVSIGVSEVKLERLRERWLTAPSG